MNRKTFVTSDTHLNHRKLAEVFQTRPMDFEHQVLTRHNAIPEHSILIHLGDFCIGKDEEMHRKWFQATKHLHTTVLVRGNHDHKSSAWYIDHGWDFVVDQFVAQYYKRKVVFSHIPVDPKVWGAIADKNVHGHTHGNSHRDHDVAHFYDPEFHVEIALENTGMEPVLLTPELVGVVQSSL